MPDKTNNIERDAFYMKQQYGDAAAQIAHLRAEIAEKNIRNPRLAEMWRAIADAIERLQRRPRGP